MTLPIGCGQLTWRRDEFSPEQVLAEIAEAGYDGAPAGGPDPDAIRTQFAAAGLKPAPGYFGAEFWDPAQRDALVAKARDHAAAHQALGLTELYVAANLTPERIAVAGHVRPEDALSDEGYAAFAETLNAVGKATLDYGVAICFHNHVGSFIETRAELDRLFALVDRDVVFLGPDFGHLAWAGDDSVQLVKDYGSAIRTVHIKDIDQAVLQRGVAAGWDYRQFSDAGIFIELGRGFVDLPGIFSELDRAGFAGWVIVETDVTQLPTAKESAVVSREYLRSIGL
ncbi:MAG: sugar phosphate isomerase/epimerase family protein [Thermomicrobiales bacterium]